MNNILADFLYLFGALAAFIAICTWLDSILEKSKKYKIQRTLKRFLDHLNKSSVPDLSIKTATLTYNIISLRNSKSKTVIIISSIILINWLSTTLSSGTGIVLESPTTLGAGILTSVESISDAKVVNLNNNSTTLDLNYWKLIYSISPVFTIYFVSLFFDIITIATTIFLLKKYILTPKLKYLLYDVLIALVLTIISIPVLHWTEDKSIATGLWGTDEARETYAFSEYTKKWDGEKAILSITPNANLENIGFSIYAQEKNSNFRITVTSQNNPTLNPSSEQEAEVYVRNLIYFSEYYNFRSNIKKIFNDKDLKEYYLDLFSGGLHPQSERSFNGRLGVVITEDEKTTILNAPIPHPQKIGFILIAATAFIPTTIFVVINTILSAIKTSINFFRWYSRSVINRISENNPKKRPQEFQPFKIIGTGLSILILPTFTLIKALFTLVS